MESTVPQSPSSGSSGPIAAPPAVSGIPRRFSAGHVLGRTFSIWIGNLVPFTILAAIVMSPLIAYTLAALPDPSARELPRGWGLIFMLGSSVLQYILAGAVIYGVFQQLRGRSAALARCVSIGLSRLLPVLGTGILVGMAVGLGMLALLIPGFIVACTLAAAVPAAVVEGRGVWDAIDRSRSLTRGSRWPIFWVTLVIGILSLGAGALADLASADMVSRTQQPRAQMLWTLVITVLLAALSPVAASVIYHDLRAVKEGIGVEELARVFE